MDKNAIIETLDYLFEKFGIAVDWTTENVLPYVEQLAERIVTYNIITETLWVIASILAIIGCCVYVRILCGSHKLCKTTKEDTILCSYSSLVECADLSTIGFVGSLIAGATTITSIVCLFNDVGDLLKWIFIPELQLVEFVSNLVSSSGVS